MTRTDSWICYFVQTACHRHLQTRPAPLRSALYHNNGDGTFTDVTAKAGVGGEGHYGQGVTVGDYNNEGWPDLYVTGYGRAILYHNNHDGTFYRRNLPRLAVADEGQMVHQRRPGSTIDKDGWLDLVVLNYLDWSPKNNLWCGERAPGYRNYCNPRRLSRASIYQALSQQSRWNFHRR
jgi:hypothetical protein